MQERSEAERRAISLPMDGFEDRASQSTNMKIFADMEFFRRFE